MFLVRFEDFIVKSLCLQPVSQVFHVVIVPSLVALLCRIYKTAYCVVHVFCSDVLELVSKFSRQRVYTSHKDVVKLVH